MRHVSTPSVAAIPILSLLVSAASASGQAISDDFANGTPGPLWVKESVEGVSNVSVIERNSRLEGVITATPAPPSGLVTGSYTSSDWQVRTDQAFRFRLAFRQQSATTDVLPSPLGYSAGLFVAMFPSRTPPMYTTGIRPGVGAAIFTYGITAPNRFNEPAGTYREFQTFYADASGAFSGNVTPIQQAYAELDAQTQFYGAGSGIPAPSIPIAGTLYFRFFPEANLVTVTTDGYAADASDPDAYLITGFTGGSPGPCQLSLGVFSQVGKTLSGANSFWDSFVLDEGVVEIAPRNFSASDGTSSNGVSLSWTAPQNASSIDIYRGQAGTTASDLIATVPATQTSYFHEFTNPADAGVPWTYTLVTDTLLEVHDEGWAFGPPRDVSASDGTLSTGVEVRWTNLTGATSYRVLRREGDSAPVVIGSPTSSPFLDTTAAAGVSYLYAVKVVMGTTPSDASDFDPGSRGIVGPTGFAATDGTRADGIMLTWSGVANATSYEVHREFPPDNYLPLATTTGTQLLVADPAVPGRIERFKVKALLTDGQETAFSNADTGWWLPKPAFFYASDGEMEGPLTLQWQSIFGEEISYRIFRAAGTATPTTQIGTSPSAFYIDETAIPGQVYNYRVRATSPAGDGPFSDADPGTMYVPGSPVEVTATDGTLLTGVRVDWIPDPDAFGISNYKVYRYDYASYPPPPPIVVATVAATVKTCTDTTAAIGVPYGYEVRGRYPSGAETTSNRYDLGWRGIAMPSGLAATGGTRSDGVNLTWTAVAGASGYRIHRAGPDNQFLVIGTTISTGFLDTTAPVGVTHAYRVAAISQSGDSALSSPATGWRNVPAPASVVASDGTSTTTILVQWPAVPGATGYRILRTTGTGAPTAVLADISDPGQTSYNDVHNATNNQLVPGTLYNYAIQSRCALGNSVSSPANTGWRNVPAPGSIVATDGTLTTGVQVTWPAVAGATGYRVFRGTTAGNLVSIATPTASSYADTTAVAGTTYLYAVAARTAAGDSAPSGTDSGWRNIGPPTAVAATDGTLPTGVNVTWTAATGVTEYRVYRAPSASPGNPTAIGTVTVSPFLDTTAEVGVQYAYTVRSVSASGESSPSAADNGWRTIQAPTGLAATDGSLTDSIQVAWNAVPGATGYRLYRAIGAGTPTEISPAASFTATTFIDSTAVAGTLYRYTVRARTSLGNSLPSSPDDGWRNVPAPTSLAATDGTSTAHVALTWTAVPGATGYAIYRRIGNGPVGPAINATGTTFNDTTAAVGQLYTYYVCAKTAAGQSANGPTDTGWRNTTAPTGVAATDGDLDTGVRISWNSVPGFGPYKVYRTLGTGTPELVTPPVGFAGSPFVDDSAAPLTVYSYTVTTVTPAGDSVPSTANTGWRNIPAPTGLVATEGNPANISITWNAAAGATGYRLYRAIGSAAPTEITPAASFTATGFTDTTAANATVYTYTVKARHALGNTQASTADTGFKTMPAPTGVAASDGTNPEGVDVSWSPIPGVSQYRIFRALGTAAPAIVGTVTSQTSFIDLTALTGTIYSYTVRGVFNGAESPASTANTGWKTLFPPGPVVASDGTSTAHVAISWTAIPAPATGLTAYRVYRSTGSAAPAAIHTTASSATTSFLDTTAVAGTLYTYFVRGVLAVGETPNSFSNSGWRNVSGPATLAATDGTVTTGVNLTWPAVTGVTAYRIHRGVDPNGSDLAPIGQVSGATTFADVTALPGVTYRYRILLTTAAGESTSASPIDAGWKNVPAPGGFTASDGTSTSAVNVSWNAVPGATSYRLERGVGGTFTVIQSEATGTSYEDQSAPAGTVLTYRIRARTPSGDSLATATDTGWRALPAPQNVQATDGTSTVNVTITWNSIGTAVPGHTGYRVYRGTGGSTPTAIATVAANVTTHVDASAVGGTPYTYSVRSLSAAGESSGNLSDSGWRNVLPPANLQATDGTRTDGVNVTWTAVTGATGYRILRGSGAGDLAEIAIATGTAFLDGTADPGLTYHYSASAVTAAGLSAASTPTNTGWRNVPAPAAFAAGDGTSTSAIELSWEAVAHATGYEIYRAAGSAAPTVLLVTISDPEQTTYDDLHSSPTNSLPAGSLFNYVVKAKTPSGLSAGTPANTGWRNIPSPGYLYASEGESLTKVDLEWPSIGASVQGHTGYRVYRRTGAATFTSLATLPIAATTYSDLTAVAGTPYEYKVAATTAAGDSFEPPISAGWRNVPAPTGFAASDDLPGVIRMSWLPVASPAVTGYRIFAYDPWSGVFGPIGTVSATTTVFETGDYFSAEFHVRAITAAGQSEPSNFDYGSIASQLAGMTAPADLPDGRLSAGGQPGSRVPDGKNGGGSGAMAPIDRDVTVPNEPVVDLPRPSELPCEAIVDRISETLRTLVSVETEEDQVLAERLAALLEPDPEDPTATIPACAMHHGDVNLDGSVDLLDLEAFLSAWSAWDLIRGDLDRDGTIDDRDLDLLGRRLLPAAVDAVPS